LKVEEDNKQVVNARLFLEIVEACLENRLECIDEKK
jgi:hypothetical protein